MTRTIKATRFFHEQVKTLPPEARKLIESKIDLIKENPYRYKKIRSPTFSRVHRVRMTMEHKECRLVYVILEPDVILVVLLDRKNDYKDLERHLKELKREK